MGFIMLWDMVDMDYLLLLILEQNWDYLCQDKKTEVLIKRYHTKPCSFIKRIPGFCHLQPVIFGF